jgi:KaiC/GvpD/RAD55 family RecA-like ATPase
MNLAEKYGIDLSKEHKTQCPRCARNGKDRSKNNLHVYGEDAGAHCFACGFTIPSLEHMEQMGWAIEGEEDFEEVMTQEKITQEEIDKIKSYTGLSGKGTRGITDETYKAYQVRHKMSEETGEPVAQYYPITEGYEGTGFKVRTLPKSFSVIGKMGTDSDLFGQWKFKNAAGKYVVITSGEIDALSAYQMLENYRKNRNSDFEPIPVVSGVVGEKSSTKQIQKQYEWLNRFDKIVYFRDMDDAGEESVHKIAKVVPKNKFYVASLPLKDVNEMLEKGKEKQFISAFYDAKLYVPSGITASNDLIGKMKEYLSTPRISLPPFMHKLQAKLRGGIPVGCITTILAASGQGKSTFVDAMTLHWIMNTDRLVGVVSLEASEGEYGVNLLSSFSEFKMNLLESVEDRLTYIASEQAEENMKKLFSREDGSPRFFLVDADIDTLVSKIEYLIISAECKIIVIDPIQDVFDGLGDEEQAKFMLWQKGWAKKGINFVNISHSRKSGQGQKANSKGAELAEEDMHGHSSIFKSSAINLILMRNKDAEDPFVRNTTICKMSKARGVGETGVVGEYYYENEAHKLWDKDDYLAAHPLEF